MLTSTAPWGWDFARDSWWPTQSKDAQPPSPAGRGSRDSCKLNQYFLPALPLPLSRSCEVIGLETYVENMPLPNSK